MSTLTPTPEQQAILDAARTGDSVTVIAAAGSGKTSTQRMIAHQATGRRGLYAAYNKSIQLEAEGTFPAGCKCSTVHSLAYRAVGASYRHRLGKDAPHVTASQAARILRINEALKLGDTMIQPNQLARLAQQAVKNFCKSGSSEIQPWHVPVVTGLEGVPERDAIRSVVHPIAVRAWKDLSSLEGRLRFSHDIYLKLWAMSDPVLPYDYILFDECQPEGTMVLVPAGSHRSVRGGVTPTAEVPIESIRPGDRVVSYDGKGLRLRPTGSVVTDVRQHRHAGHVIVASTPEGKLSRYTPDHKCMAVTGPALAGRQVVYLMRRGASFRIGVTQGLDRHKNAGPRTRLQEERGDESWVLSVHESRADALAAEALASWKYGIPQMRFRGTPDQQPAIDGFWNKVGDLTDAARTCLLAHGRMIEYPLWSRLDSSYTLTHRPTVVRACNLMDGMALVDASAMLSRTGQRRASDLDLRPVTVTREVFHGTVWSLEVEGDHTYVADGLVTHNCQDANPVVLRVIQAQASHAQLIAVGDPCQAINGWNGAVNAMNLFEAPHRLALSTSFRFGPAIAAEANKWLGLLDAEYRITGNDRLSSMIRDVDTPDAILCRSNSKAIEQVMDRVGRGQRVALAGGADDLVRLAQAAVTLKAGTGTDHPALFAFKTWLEVQDYAENDPSGSDLKVFVKLIDDHGPDQIIESLEQLADRRRCDVMISTAHKAKGMEWDSVRVATDFREPQEQKDGTPGEIKPEQMMLAYVSVTRARLSLDRAGLAWVDRYITPAAPAAAADAPAGASDSTAAADLALTGATA